MSLPNLDAMDREELVAFTRDKSNKSVDFALARLYARSAVRAMAARHQGRIADAIRIESEREDYYKGISAENRW